MQAQGARLRHHAASSVAARPSAGDLLQEFKRKEAVVSAERQFKETRFKAALDQQKRLRERISGLDPHDSRYRLEASHLQNQLNAVEQVLRSMSSRPHVAGQAPDEFKNESHQDLLDRFCNSVAVSLSECDGRSCLLSHLSEQPRVKAAWLTLTRSRIIRQSTGMQEVFLKNSTLFRVYSDSEGFLVVQFVGDKDVAPAAPPPPPPTFISGALALGPSSAMPPTFQPGMASVFPAAGGFLASGMPPGIPANFTGVLPPGVSIPPLGFPPATTPAGDDQSSGSSSTVLALSQSGPAVSPMLMHPILRPDVVAAVEVELLKAGGTDRSRRICLHFGCQEEQLARHFRLFEEKGKTMVTHVISEQSQLEASLARLSTKRGPILEAMSLCLDHADPHAALFAKVLARSLQVPNLEVEMALARLFLVSDVLYNSGSCAAKGAARYRSLFEGLLPDACDALGRQYLRPLAQPDRGVAETAVRRLLDAWRTWDVFPSVFVGGLEALLLGSAPDDAPIADAVLRQKLARWATEESAANIPKAAKRRGLCGSGASVADCRKRLCQYERYWHRSGAEGMDETVTSSINGLASSAPSTEAAAHSSSGRKSREQGQASAEAPDVDMDVGSIDGESLSESDEPYLEAERRRIESALEPRVDSMFRDRPALWVDAVD